MMSFYDRKGPKSWTEGGVPNYVTSNGYIAKVYAKVVSYAFPVNNGDLISYKNFLPIRF